MSISAWSGPIVEDLSTGETLLPPRGQGVVSAPTALDGVSYSVKILGSNYKWEQTFSSEEDFKKILSYTTREFTGLFSATLMPVRTNNLRNFSKDFFLPTLVNHALKIENIVAKIIVSIYAFVLDCCTFPIRVITAIPRTIINFRKANHPLHQYLKTQGVADNLLASDSIDISLGIVKRNSGEEIARHNIKFNVNFIQMPRIKGHNSCRVSTGGSGSGYAEMRQAAKAMRQAAKAIYGETFLKDRSLSVLFGI